MNMKVRRAAALLSAIALLPACAAFAETAADSFIPVAVVSSDAADETADDAVESLLEAKENTLTRYERVLLSDGREAWIICQFDQSTMTDATCRMIDAATMEVLSEDTTNTGFFSSVCERWEQVKGIYELWSLQDKALFDRLYSFSPCYGEPDEGDMTPEEALASAMEALGITSADYDAVGYGYVTGFGEDGGMWQVYFVKDNECFSMVNLDARESSILMVDSAEDGNG